MYALPLVLFAAVLFAKYYCLFADDAHCKPTTKQTNLKSSPQESRTAEIQLLGYKVTNVAGLYEYLSNYSIIEEVTKEYRTQLWATIHVPSDFESTSTVYPLVVFLHGNHKVYESGKPLEGDIPTEYYVAGCREVRNHRGYEYLSSELVKGGYVVASINTNCITTIGEESKRDIRLRADLVVEHLKLFSDWTAGKKSSKEVLQIDLSGRLDLKRIGLMGHSRGGEAMRLLHTKLTDGGKGKQPAGAPHFSGDLKIRALLEIGPTDFSIPDAFGIQWLCILPICDGDVSDFQGIHTFDRMIANHNAPSDGKSKSVWHVWGANHNFFNTRWFKSDVEACRLQMPPVETQSIDNAYPPLTAEDRAMPGRRQRRIALKAIKLMFDTYVAGKMSLEEAQHLLDPVNKLPEELANITVIARSFAPSSGAKGYVILDDISTGNISENGCDFWSLFDDGHGLKRCLRSSRNTLTLSASTWNDGAGHNAQTVSGIAVAPDGSGSGRGSLRIMNPDLANNIPHDGVFEARVSVGIRRQQQVANTNWNSQQIFQETEPSRFALFVQLVNCGGNAVGNYVNANDFMIIKPTPVRQANGILLAHELLQTIRIPVQTLLKGERAADVRSCVAGVVFYMSLPEGPYEFNFANLRFQLKQ